MILKRLSIALHFNRKERLTAMDSCIMYGFMYALKFNELLCVFALIDYNLSSSLILSESGSSHVIYLDKPIILHSNPASGGAVLRSKLVDGRWQIQSPVTLVDLAVRIFP